MIIPKRILGNILGRRARVLFHSDPTLVGVSGTIAFETREMLELTTDRGKRILISKRPGVFEIWFGDKEKVIIDGAVLARRFRLLRRLGRRK